MGSPVTFGFSSGMLSACPVEARSYNAAMLDIKWIRDHPDLARQRLATRGAGDEAKIDELLSRDEQRRKLLAEAEVLKSQRNRVSKEIGALMGQQKMAEADAKKLEMRGLGEQITALDQQEKMVAAARDELLLGLPNLPHEDVARRCRARSG